MPSSQHPARGRATGPDYAVVRHTLTTMPFLRAIWRLVVWLWRALFGPYKRCGLCGATNKPLDSIRGICDDCSDEYAQEISA